jgi:uncharacterized membrane protein
VGYLEISRLRTTEANVIWPRASIENLQGDLAGELIGPGKTDNGQYSFDVLAMNGRPQWNSWTKHEHVYAQATVAKGIFHMKNEVSETGQQ